MKIKSIRIENFRSFVDQEIPLNDYSCFVGANGAGKSTVLCALNVFFKEQDSSATDTQKLCDEDFFRRNTSDPIRITLTFTDLSEEAKAELADYVRQSELVVTASASFDTDSQVAVVRHYGQRLGMEEFRGFFDAAKQGVKAGELGEIYSELQELYPDLPDARSKDAKIEELRRYESDHPENCVVIPSEDDFYGINSTGKLAQFVQWVYVPAVKDASEEGQESKNTALGRLIARAVRSRTNFDEELEGLRRETLENYQALLDKNREGLDCLTESLQSRLASWAHPDVKIDLAWLTDEKKSVQVAQPVAGIRTGDGEFIGDVARMGHGLQRSYLLALLQELASSEANQAPTLILGCEEPELYQHPPQARHLADVFAQLAEGNSQVLVTTHSPFFVSGNGFENVRLVRMSGGSRGTSVTQLAFEDLCAKLRDAHGHDVRRRIEGLVAKIHQSLRPQIAEMFFTKIPVLVEGMEDASYITTALHLSGRWGEFRRFGCHVIPADKKSNLIRPIAIATELGIPFFALCDADGDCRDVHRDMHSRDNSVLLKLLNADIDPFPEADYFGQNFAVWKFSLTKTVESEFGDAITPYKDAARRRYAHEGGLDKHDLFISELLTAAHDDGSHSATLESLCDAILEYARTHAST